MSDHRRPNDHLVEPLFGGLDGADGRSLPPGRGPRRVLLALLAISIAAGLLVLWA